MFVPDTDIYEREESILVRCDMPGVDEKELKIILEDDELTLTGPQADDQPQGYNPLVEEYRTGVYQRSFTVSQKVDHENIKAHIQNGVLELVLPKAAQARPKKIEVEVN